MRFLLVLCMVFVMASPVCAGWLDDAVRGAAEGAGRRAVDDAADSSYEGVKEGSKESVGNGRADQPGQQEQLEPGAPEKPRKAADVHPVQTRETQGDSSDIVSVESIYGKYDFIPGDKVIFSDDFSDTDVGEFPRKWSLKAPGGGGNTVEVVDYKGKRFLRSVPPQSKEEGLTASSLYTRLTPKGDMPEKFTVEFDAVLNQTNGYSNEYYLLMFDDDGWPGRTPGSIYISGEKGSSHSTSTSVNKNDGKVHHIAVSVNGTFVKAYIDNQRVVNDPDAVTRPVKYIGMSLHANHGYSETEMFTNFRVAEGGKDMKGALDTEGKIVTHGILFDTGLDRIKPESLPALKKILGLLQNDQALKFFIEGHTDNQGGSSLNQPLSERRAAAVKTWLVDKGISAERLQTKGLGDSKPIDTNDTPEGRANNRRVEFIRIS